MQNISTHYILPRIADIVKLFIKNEVCQNGKMIWVSTEIFKLKL